MSDIKIDKNVPMLKAARGYPFKTMEIGDSFLVPSDISEVYQKTIAGMGNRQHKPMRFRSKKTPEGYRVWRIA